MRGDIIDAERETDAGNLGSKITRLKSGVITNDINLGIHNRSLLTLILDQGTGADHDV